MPLADISNSPLAGRHHAKAGTTSTATKQLLAQQPGIASLAAKLKLVPGLPPACVTQRPGAASLAAKLKLVPRLPPACKPVRACLSLVAQMERSVQGCTSISAADEMSPCDTEGLVHPGRFRARGKQRKLPSRRNRAGSAELVQLGRKPTVARMVRECVVAAEAQSAGAQADGRDIAVPVDKIHAAGANLPTQAAGNAQAHVAESEAAQAAAASVSRGFLAMVQGKAAQALFFKAAQEKKRIADDNAKVSPGHMVSPATSETAPEKLDGCMIGGAIEPNKTSRIPRHRFILFREKLGMCRTSVQTQAAGQSVATEVTHQKAALLTTTKKTSRNSKVRREKEEEILTTGKNEEQQNTLAKALTNNKIVAVKMAWQQKMRVRKSTAPKSRDKSHSYAPTNPGALNLPRSGATRRTDGAVGMAQEVVATVEDEAKKLTFPKVLCVTEEVPGAVEKKQVQEDGTQPFLSMHATASRVQVRRAPGKAPFAKMHLHACSVLQR